MATTIVEPVRDYTDITRQDSSITLRGKVRAFWDIGQQLWDVDVNNNFAHANRWLVRKCAYARLYPRARVYPGPFESYPEYTTNNVVYLGGNGAVYPAQTGFVTYGASDRIFKVNVGDSWHTIGHAPTIVRPVEIAFFVGSPQYRNEDNAEIIRHIVREPFVILPATGEFFGFEFPSDYIFDGNWETTEAFCCNYRFDAKKLSYLMKLKIRPEIYRNDELVGTYSWGPDRVWCLKIKGPVLFATGDELSIRCGGAWTNMAITIVGQRL